MDLADAIKRAKRVYIAGNGGSAANAIHLANDLIACGIKAHALTADVATLTAIANDYGYEYIFSRQLAVYGEEGDLLLVLSGSGNSRNVLEALLEADRKNIVSWAITGAYGEPRAAQLADNAILVGHDMQAAENAQLEIGHQILRWLRNT